MNDFFEGLTVFFTILLSVLVIITTFVVGIILSLSPYIIVVGGLYMIAKLFV